VIEVYILREASEGSITARPNISLKKHVVLNIYCKIDTRNSLDRSLRSPHNTHETVFIQQVCVLEVAVNILKKVRVL